MRSAGEAAAKVIMTGIKFHQKGGGVYEVNLIHDGQCPEGSTVLVKHADGKLTRKPEQYPYRTVQDADGDGAPDAEFLPCGQGVRGMFGAVHPEAQKVFADAKALAQRGRAFLDRKSLTCQPLDKMAMTCESASAVVIFESKGAAIPADQVAASAMKSGKALVEAVDTTGDGIPDVLFAAFQDSTYGNVALIQMPVTMTKEEMPATPPAPPK